MLWLYVYITTVVTSIIFIVGVALIINVKLKEDIQEEKLKTLSTYRKQNRTIKQCLIERMELCIFLIPLLNIGICFICCFGFDQIYTMLLAQYKQEIEEMEQVGYEFDTTK